MSVNWTSEELDAHNAKQRPQILPKKGKKAPAKDTARRKKYVEGPPQTQMLRVPSIGPSLNTYGRSTKRLRQKGRLAAVWIKMVKLLVKEQGLRPVVNYPVQVVIECYFGPEKRRYDWDNLSPTPKLIQDGIVQAGILTNDSPAYVKSGTMVPLKTKEESYTLFYIIEPTRKAA